MEKEKYKNKSAREVREPLRGLPIVQLSALVRDSDRSASLSGCISCCTTSMMCSTTSCAA